MSSTNRGAVRQPDDLYITPAWAVKAIGPRLTKSGSIILDPAVGTGVLLAVEDDFDHITLTRGMDVVDRGWPNTTVRDALSPEPWPEADLIICNPPYSLAFQFLKRALREVSERGEVAFLLRLAWMAGLERARFHLEHPSDVYVLSKRPSFTTHLKWTDVRCNMFLPAKPGKKPKQCDREFGHDDECMAIGTDSCEYAWFVWGYGRGWHWQVLT